MPGSSRRFGAWWRLAFGLGAVFLSRLAVLYSPYWDEIPYEPAPLGLEALAVLRGETPVLYWGQPYFGTFFSYLLAPFYALGTDPVRTFGWVAIGVAVCGAAAVYGFARRLWGEMAGLAALAYLVVPSAYYSYHTLTAYAVFQALGSIACFAALAQLVDRPAHPRWVWLCGLALGASTWCQQLGLYYTLAVGAAFLAVERRRLCGALGGRLAAGFLLGSAPLWTWNALFDWITVKNFLTGEYAPVSLGLAWSGLWESVGSLVAANPQFWLDPGGYAAWMRYGQLLVAGLLVFGAAQWMVGRRELRVGAGLVFALFAVTAFFYAKSRWGVSPTFARYLLPLATIVPILVGGAVATTARRSRPLAAALLFSALLPGLHDHLRYARWSEQWRDRGARVAIAALDRLGITRAYAHDRISLPINLASRERIIVSDYYGVPYTPYLNVVDDTAAPAIIAHEILQIPHPTELARSLGVLGGHFRRLKAGPYWIFYDFRPPRGGGGWLPPAQWKLDAVTASGDLATLVDRDALSGWSTNRPRAAGDWLSVDLGATRSVDEVHLLCALRIREIPTAAVLETSLDGRTWTVRSRLDGLNWYWWNGHPKLDDEGRVSFYFDPTPARHLRVRVLDDSPERRNWSVTEIFIRAADAPEDHRGGGDLRTGLLAERRGFVGISHHSLHAHYAPAVDSTPWGEVARAYHRAARKSPDDPEPLYRLGRVLWIKRFPEGGPDRRQGLALEALGLDDLAAAEFARCAALEAGSLCADRALGHTRNEAERAGLRELRRRFDPASALAADLGAVELSGRGMLPERVEAGGHFTLELFWKCLRPLDRDLAVFTHAAGPDGARFQADHPPAGGTLPTSRWQPGETIRDAVEVVVPAGIAPGRYTVRAGLWDPVRRSRLRRSLGATGAVVVGSFEVVPPAGAGSVGR